MEPDKDDLCFYTNVLYPHLYQKLGTDESIGMMAFARSKDRNARLQFNDPGPEFRPALAALIRKALADMDAEAVFFIAESWKVEILPNETVPSGEEIETHPRRTEIVAIYLESKEGTWIAYAPILRKHGVPHLPEVPPELTPASDFSGVLTHLLPEAKP